MLYPPVSWGCWRCGGAEDMGSPGGTGTMQMLRGGDIRDVGTLETWGCLGRETLGTPGDVGMLRMSGCGDAGDMGHWG